MQTLAETVSLCTNEHVDGHPLESLVKLSGCISYSQNVPGYTHQQITHAGQN